MQRGTEVPFEVTVNYKLESQPSGFVTAGLSLLSGKGVGICQGVDVSQGSGTVVISGLFDVEHLYNWVETGTVYLEVYLWYKTAEEEVWALDWEHTTEYPYYIEGEAPPENQPPVDDIEKDQSISYVTDASPPKVAISYPSNGQTLTNSIITVTGTSSDDIAVDSVEIKVADTGWQPTSGTTSWSAEITLEPGSNIVYARAIDTSGKTAQVSVTIVYNPQTYSTGEDAKRLRDQIDGQLKLRPAYPPYLLGANSSTLWLKFTDQVKRTELTKEYDELYRTGVDYDCLRIKALIKAEEFLEKGDTATAEKYLQKSLTYRNISYMSFQLALDAYSGSLDAGEKLAKTIKESSEFIVKCGFALINPAFGKAADYAYIAVDYAVDRVLVGRDQAAKNAVVKAVLTIILDEVEFKGLDDRTISDYTKNRVGKVTFPMLQDIFQNEQAQFILSKMIKESGVQLGGKVAEDLVNLIIDGLKNVVNVEQSKVKSPVELRVYDSHNRATGLLNGKASQGIPMSFYDGETVFIFFPEDSYRYEVLGTNEGTYGLEIVSIKDSEVTTFTATAVPTSANTIHQYTVDWDILSQGGKGATLQIDADGDGKFEKTFTADSEFTYDEFVSEMARLSFWIWIAGGAVITLILVISCILIKRRLARK